METSKPDLMSASPRVQGKRILAQLEHGPRAPAVAVRAAGWTIDGWSISLCALLLLMCVAAWLLHDQRITPETFRPGPAYTTTRATTSPARAASIAHPQAREQAAAIINEPGETAGPATVRAGAAPTGVAPTPTAVTAAIANAAAAQASPRVVQYKPGPTRPASAAPSTTAAAGDTDVTLLTALVAHAGQSAPVTSERSRDVVERQDGDTTEQLLARCRQLGMIEGMLCRSRICSGRWEADAACRAPAQGHH
ncbi:hypothetical protein [Duganella sp. P38]|uniref:hypothetical protein n=1 Tax=Duganella sp. P38 TaxID=3423949 RepID=UPI003D79C22A